VGFLDRLKSRAAAVAPQSPGSVGVGCQFAFLDVETTGLDPANDRILEVGIVVTDSRGTVLEEWSTLVNPGRGVKAGVTHIHGIESTWLAAAPPFPAISHEIARRVAGRVVAAHNSRFDCSFLEEEFRRAGYADSGDWVTICTLDLADKLNLPKRFPVLCAQLGIPHTTHDALGDARACAQVLHRFLPVIDSSTFVDIGASTMGMVPLDGPPVSCVCRDQAKTETRVRAVLGPLVDALPPYDTSDTRDPAASSAYLTSLEDAVADGYVSSGEVESLTRLARQLELTGEEVRDLHRQLVIDLIDRALDDRKMSRSEREEIERVAAWLGVDLHDWDTMVKAGRARVKAAVAEFRADVVGKSIVFAGAGVHPPNIREAFAAKYGFTYGRRVSERTDLVVIGTSDTDTAQVVKAGQLGVPVMVEVEFWRRLGEL
jgi:DNA polymerase III subunit epsilon